MAEIYAESSVEYGISAGRRPRRAIVLGEGITRPGEAVGKLDVVGGLGEEIMDIAV